MFFRLPNFQQNSSKKIEKGTIGWSIADKNKKKKHFAGPWTSFCCHAYFWKMFLKFKSCRPHWRWSTVALVISSYGPRLGRQLKWRKSCTKKTVLNQKIDLCITLESGIWGIWFNFCETYAKNLRVFYDFVTFYRQKLLLIQ